MSLRHSVPNCSAREATAGNSMIMELEASKSLKVSMSVLYGAVHALGIQKYSVVVCCSGV